MHDAGVDADTRRGIGGDDRRGDPFDDAGRIGAQRATTADPDDAVDHQVGAPRLVDDAAPGAAQRSEPGGVGAIRGEQNRFHHDAASPQVGTREQGVATVVPGPDEQGHPAAGDAAGASGQFLGAHAGEAVRGASHECTVGQGCEQGRFRVADGAGQVVVPHDRHGTADRLT